uniref:SCO6745 family protein n=1 Tax=Mycobacterium sp. TaxID=1785 RepID=UPI0031D29D2B
MDALAAGRLTRSLDALHAVVYFAPEADAKFGELGMESTMHYFAGRAAPMGVVAANVVAATFYNFSPKLVASAIPSAWELASPAVVTRVRYEIVAAALPRVVGEERVGSAELARVTAALRSVAEAIPNADGRPLYAGHAELPWPDAPVEQLWHAITLLREYRGDGHIAALVTHGLSGLEALITHTATGIGFNPEYARRLRGWSRDEWNAAVEGLISRGLLGADGELTPAGAQLRSTIEDLTDELGFAPWRALPADQADELAEFAKAIRVAVAGVFPAELFGPRHGQPR